MSGDGAEEVPALTETLADDLADDETLPAEVRVLAHHLAERVVAALRDYLTRHPEAIAELVEGGDYIKGYKTYALLWPVTAPPSLQETPE